MLSSCLMLVSFAFIILIPIALHLLTIKELYPLRFNSTIDMAEEVPLNRRVRSHWPNNRAIFCLNEQSWPESLSWATSQSCLPTMCTACFQRGLVLAEVLLLCIVHRLCSSRILQLLFCSQAELYPDHLQQSPQPPSSLHTRLSSEVLLRSLFLHWSESWSFVQLQNIVAVAMR